MHATPTLAFFITLGLFTAIGFGLLLCSWPAKHREREGGPFLSDGPL